MPSTKTAPLHRPYFINGGLVIILLSLCQSSSLALLPRTNSKECLRQSEASEDD